MKPHLQSKTCIGLITLLLLATLCPLHSDAQDSRERYRVVEAAHLAEYPQRFWGRGVVFEDVFESRIGRTQQTGGRRFSGISTRELGRIYVAPGLEETVEGLEPGRAYLFAGVVVGESGMRIPFMGARTRYWLAIEEIEAVVDADEDELLSLILDSETDHFAFAPILEAVQSAQNQLIARASNEDVPVQSLFDPRAPRQDAAIQAARNAVRDLSNKTGITAAEYLSILVRELLARQYDLDDPETSAPESPASPTQDLSSDSLPVYNGAVFDETPDADPAGELHPLP